VNLEPSQHYGNWSGADIEEFLSQTRVPLRLSFVSKNGLLIVPVWFEYRASCFWSCSPSDSLLVKALRLKPQVAFDVSTNDIPYKGVRGRGFARCTVVPDNTALEGLMNRYIAGTDNDLAQWLLNRAGSEAVIQIEVAWLTSWDFSARMESIEKISARLPGQAL
jgi:nitroimidazol reductase NimA-like FMN-containing flavoprotein (pyridoxamine 5'-phosphate oxidase superfamily)